MQARQSELFAQLGASLEAFQAAIEGEPGHEVETIGAEVGKLPDLIRKTVEGIAEVLAWLQRGMADAEMHIVAANAAIALFEVGGEALEALAEGIEIGPAADLVHGEKALAAINTAISQGHAVLGEAAKLADSVVPPVEDAIRVREALSALLGERAGTGPAAGALGLLMTRIGL
jgi:hypothetical protein